MNRIAAVAGLLVSLASLTLSAHASANVSKVGLVAGRLSKPESCFVQVDLETVEQDLFNGQEKLQVGTTEIGSFAPLLTSGTTLSAGKSVLFGSPSFNDEAKIAPDISITDEQCAQLAPDANLSFVGSFGPIAGEFLLPIDFDALTVVGIALLIHLETESYKVKSLEGEKTIGPFGDESSGNESSSGETSSGGTNSSGGASSGDLSTSAPSSSDGSCSVVGGAIGFTHAGAMGLGAAAFGMLLAARRRSGRTTTSTPRRRI